MTAIETIPVSDVQIGDRIVIGDALDRVTAIEDIGYAFRLRGWRGQIVREHGKADTIRVER